MDRARAFADCAPGQYHTLKYGEARKSLSNPRRGRAGKVNAYYWRLWRMDNSR